MNDIWKIVVSIIISVGGSGAIISTVVFFCSNLIAKRLEQRYSSVLAKELEKYKSMLDEKKYVSKVRFDKEFEIYLELSSDRLNIVFSISDIINNITILEDNLEEFENRIKMLGYQDINKYMNNKIDDMITLYNKFNFSYRKYAAFVSVEISALINELYQQCNIQMQYVQKYYDMQDSIATLSFPKEIDLEIITPFVDFFSNKPQKEELWKTIKEQAENISLKCDEVTIKIREHLDNLEAKS